MRRVKKPQDQTTPEQVQSAWSERKVSLQEASVPNDELLQELMHLVRTHKWFRNGARVNLAHPTDEINRKYGRPLMKRGIYSNTVRDGRMLEIVQEMPPGITHLCLNRDVTCAPPRDAKNTSEYSYVLSFGEFVGGELRLETGECFREHKVWRRL